MSLSTAVERVDRTRAGLRLRDCLDAADPLFAEMTAEIAQRRGVDERALRVRALLHLPRIAGYSGRLHPGLVRAELRRLAGQLADDVRRVADRIPPGTWQLQQLEFAEIPARIGAPIIEARHYLRSARADARYYALLDPVWHLPVTICSVSPLQWRRVANQIAARSDVPRERIRDVSRVFAQDESPWNAISFLLARVRTALRQSGEVDLLTTAVDRNLGFRGTSYRAAGWQHWITVQPRPYLYLDRSYVTPRQLRDTFGTSAVAELRERNPRQVFEQSRVRLRESFIFCRRIRGETEVIPENARLTIHR